MIKSLRKRHLQVWTALTILLPAGIIAGAVVVPKYQRDHLLQPATTKALPVAIKTSETANYSMTLRTDEGNTALQIEWTNKKELAVPTSLIYQVSKEEEDLKDALLIGRIAEKGTYRFAIKKEAPDTSYHFIVYDIIHHKNIYDISL